jgi:hypothetical protein
MMLDHPTLSRNSQLSAVIPSETKDPRISRSADGPKKRHLLPTPFPLWTAQENISGFPVLFHRRSTWNTRKTISLTKKSGADKTPAT